MTLTFQEYSEQASKTAKYPIDKWDSYLPIALAGEVGELLNKVKKVIRDNNGILTYEARLQLLGELGDVLWYLDQYAYHLGSSLEEVAQHNNDKLADRAKRNVIHGSGDER